MKFNITNSFKQYIKKAKNKEISYKFFAFLAYALIFFILIYIIINRLGSFKIFNYEGFIIVSDSMSPEIKKGDIVIIKQTPESHIKQGDIVTYERDGEYITHRIYEIKVYGETKTYITKGDNNPVCDEGEVEFSDIKGVKISKIPLVGLFIIEISKQKYIVIILIIFIILYKRAKTIDNRKVARRKKKKIEDEKIEDEKIH